MSVMQVEDVIKRPLYLTEKGAKLREEENKYVFEVDLEANKLQIKDAVEALFKVRVTKVPSMSSGSPGSGSASTAMPCTSRRRVRPSGSTLGGSIRRARWPAWPPPPARRRHPRTTSTTSGARIHSSSAP